jgi:hypothetical protein
MLESAENHKVNCGLFISVFNMEHKLLRMNQFSPLLKFQDYQPEAFLMHHTITLE